MFSPLASRKAARTDVHIGLRLKEKGIQVSSDLWFCFGQAVFKMYRVRKKSDETKGLEHLLWNIYKGDNEAEKQSPEFKFL